ncbi:branched-chain amino acid transport system II carrier protein [Veillonella sp. R32]|uniref:branched-chain amino acid transport system II carrier protein n=1 Tax=Veillonella sp. R32 TaxID=2021312 RepID=UPI00138A04F6|nr:branched-chain amino acid transport system II carrier protein [Veillonella sp. R32]KAF1682880.1 branched-chain amino acid transport system II carrier protein [Veillonella sp. R32]
MKGKLSLSSAIVIGSMLFGMFFGAGNLIFPVHMGQEAGADVWPATLGFLITAIGLPFLGVVAIGISRSSGLYDLATRIHPTYAKLFTVLLYLTIGPAFALPRTATVSYQIGLAPYIGDEVQTIALATFTLVFFVLALFFSMNPGKLMTYIGKILNPLFLIFLAILLVVALLSPMGSIHTAPISGDYTTMPFFKGFTEGYNTMDALAALAFGIIVIRAMQEVGVKEPKDIAVGMVKAGFVTVILMVIIYAFLAYVGASSLGVLPLSANGGIALAQIAQYYFGSIGAVLLAIIVTLACLKTAVGLICACSETFAELFPNSISYKKYAYTFALISFLIGNVGLTQIISLAIPILMLLYPLTITIILLTFLAPIFKGRQAVYLSMTVFALLAAIGDALNTLPSFLGQQSFVQSTLQLYKMLPFFDLGMGWIVPSAIGFVLGLLYIAVKKSETIA